MPPRGISPWARWVGIGAMGVGVYFTARLVGRAIDRAVDRAAENRSPPPAPSITTDAYIPPVVETGGWNLVARGIGQPSRPLDREVMKEVRAVPEAVLEHPSDIRAQVIRTVPLTAVESALETLLSSNPQVLAVGEEHLAEGFQGLQASIFFQQRLLPVLATRYHLKNFVYEALPVLPPILDGIRKTPSSGLLFGLRSGIQGEVYRQEFDAIFASREKYDLVLYGSKFTHEESRDADLLAQKRPDLEDAVRWQMKRRLIRDHAAETASSIVKKGQRAVLYSGGAHIPPFKSFESRKTSIINLEGKEQLFDTFENSFGPIFVQKGYRYTAVYLFFPSVRCASLEEFRQKRGAAIQSQILNLSPLWYLNRHGLIPPTGQVNLVHVTSKGSAASYYHLVFPYES